MSVCGRVLAAMIPDGDLVAEIVPNVPSHLNVVVAEAFDLGLVNVPVSVMSVFSAIPAATETSNSKYPPCGYSPSLTGPVIVTFVVSLGTTVAFTSPTGESPVYWSLTTFKPGVISKISGCGLNDTTPSV